jgi:hypothetical protein
LIVFPIFQTNSSPAAGRKFIKIIGKWAFPPALPKKKNKDYMCNFWLFYLREVKKMCEIRFNEYNKTQEKYYWIQAQEKQFQRRVQAYKFQVKTLENGKKDIFSVQNQLLQANTGLKELKEKYICKINSERGNNMEDVKNREARTKFEEEMMQEYLRSRSATNSSHTQQDSINMEYYIKKTSKENLHRQNVINYFFFFSENKLLLWTLKGHLHNSTLEGGESTSPLPYVLKSVKNRYFLCLH